FLIFIFGQTRLELLDFPFQRLFFDIFHHGVDVAARRRRGLARTAGPCAAVTRGAGAAVASGPRAVTRGSRAAGSRSVSRAPVAGTRIPRSVSAPAPRPVGVGSARVGRRTRVTPSGTRTPGRSVVSVHAGRRFPGDDQGGDEVHQQDGARRESRGREHHD